MKNDLDDLAFRSLDSLEGGAGGALNVRAPLADRLRRFAPGVLLTGLVALAAQWLSEHYTAPVMLFALLLGIAVNFAGSDARLRPGIDFAARHILRLGVALLGLRITFDKVISIGGGAILLVTAGAALTLFSGWLLARILKLDGRLGILMGGAVAICGASAALAIASVLPRTKHHERDTILTVVGVTALSTIAMVVYPAIAAAIGFDDRAAGLFFGATIHDVAQVVGAGYGFSDSAGDVSTIVKLYRVALLLPVVVFIAFLFRRERRAAEGGRSPPLIPAFLIAFAVLVAVNSTGVLPAAVNAVVSDISRWCLVIAVAALGTKTSLGDLVKVGPKPVVIMAGASLTVALFVLAGLLWMGI